MRSLKGFLKDINILSLVIESENSRFRKKQVPQRIIELDEKWRTTQYEVQQMKTELNMIQREYGKLMGLINYPGMVKSDAETTPGGGGKNKMSIGSGTEKITMKKSDL